MIRKSLVACAAALFAIFTLVNIARAQTNYPANATIEVRDANGNIITTDVAVQPGDPMQIFSTGWQPGATITFTFFSDPIILGYDVADARGEVDATFPVPDVEPGMHTLRLTGFGANGQQRAVDYPIRVAARPAATNPPGAGGAGSGAGGVGSGAGGVAGDGGGSGSLGGSGSGLSSGSRLGSATGSGSGSGGAGGAFGLTGMDADEFAKVGFALLAIGAALVVAVRRSRHRELT